MLFIKMLLQRIVIQEVLRVLASCSSIAKMAALVLLAAMGKQLVIAIKPLPAKATLRMTLEATLIDSARVVVSKFLMSSQLLGGE